MKTVPENKGVLQTLHYVYNRILNSKIFNIQKSNLIFKPEKNTSFHILKVNNMNVEHELHNHRPNTRPVAEKQTLLKEKKKEKLQH